MTATLEQNPHTTSNEYGTPWGQEMDSLESMLDGPQTETQEPLASAGSRIGNWLRKLAGSADSTAETFHDTKEAVASRLQAVGAAGINSLKKVGNVSKDVGLATVGAGIMVAEKAADSVQTYIDDQREAGQKAEQWAYQKTNEAIDFGRNNVARGREWIQAKREAAATRKAARRAKWAARLTAAKDFVTSTVDSALEAGATAAESVKNFTIETAERGRNTYHVARAVGAAALEGAKNAATETYTAHTDQNRVQ